MIKGKIDAVVLVAVMLLAPVAYAGMMGSVAATNIPTVTVSVPEYISGSFEATIEVEDVSNLNSGQFDLTFDPDVINVTDVLEGEIDGVTIPIDDNMWEFMSYDRIRVLFKLPDVETVNGSGYLAKIGFEVKGENGDTSELEISKGLLVDYDGEGMDANWNGAALTVAMGPSVTVNAPAAASDSFEVQIEIDDVEDLDAAQFDLNFDPNLLAVTSISDGEIDGEAVPVKRWSFDPADPGKLRVVLDFPGVKGVSGSGVLARIGFDPVGDGVSELVLDNVTLGDINADDIEGVQLESSTVEVTLPRPGGTVISISDIAAIGTITVPITIENATNVGSCDLTLSYDPTIVIVSDVGGGEFDSLQANLEDASDGVIRIGTYQTSSPGLNGDVVLAEVTFMTMGGMESSTTLDLEVTTLKDATPECNPIPCLVEDGSFTVLLKGDANGDGRIDMADCMYLAKNILGISGFEQIVEAAVDVNGDGEIDMADCMYLAKHILDIAGFEELK
ncbi:MAG: cohesin domain-containing protein [Candidatus Syntropharchaeales archaeon]